MEFGVYKDPQPQTLNPSGLGLKGFWGVFGFRVLQKLRGFELRCSWGGLGLRG